MANIRNILVKSLISEERKLPSDESLAKLPSIYKTIKRQYLPSFIDTGFQHQLAGDGGTAYGEGVYAGLRVEDGMSRLGSYYGDTILEGKVLGGLRNFIFFNAEQFPIIANYITHYYGRLISPAEQIRTIVKDENDAQILINARLAMNSGHAAKICRKWGIRGMAYRDGDTSTVLAFDFSSVILWAASQKLDRYNCHGKSDVHFTRIFDVAARERYERGNDWDFQLYGRYDWYDRTNAPKIAINNEMYCVVRESGRGYNIVQIDTEHVYNPKPREISDIWFSEMPSSPSIKTGQFDFKYGGFMWHATVFLPGANCPAIWFPESISDFNRPDINDTDNWIEMDKSQLEEALQEMRKQTNPYQMVGESMTKRQLKESITANTEEEFLSHNRTYVYRATGESTLPSIFENGSLRQFGGSNDGLWYGNGVYAVVPKNTKTQDSAVPVQYSKYDKEHHRAGVKMIVQGGFKRFLIFDEYWANVVYGGRHSIKDQIYTLMPREAADKLWVEIDDWLKNDYKGCRNTMDPSRGRTTGMLHMMFNTGNNRKRFEDLFSKYHIRGAVYNGGNDGLAMVCWNYDQVIPFEYTLDCGRTWRRDRFNFDAAKERSFRNVDPVSKFRHAYNWVDDNFVNCDVNGQKINVTTVGMNGGGYNIINVNMPAGKGEISPVPFDSQPQIGIKGQILFKYKGIRFQGTLYLPEAGCPAVWFPEDINMFNKMPDISSPDDWITFEDLDAAVQEIAENQ